MELKQEDIKKLKQQDRIEIHLKALGIRQRHDELKEGILWMIPLVSVWIIGFITIETNLFYFCILLFFIFFISAIVSALKTTKKKKERFKELEEEFFEVKPCQQ